MTTQLLGPSVEAQAAYANAQITFQAAFLQYLETQSDPLEAFAKAMPSSTAATDYIFLGDVPGFEEWIGDRPMGSLQAHKLHVANKDFASGVPIHRNQIMDDQLGLVYPSIERLAQKAKRHPGQQLAKLFMNGFGGTDFPDVGDGTCYDGALFFSASHVLEGGATQSNTLGTTALSYTALETAITTARGFTTFDGKDPLEFTPTHLLVGPALEWTAKRLVKQKLVVRNAGDGADTNIHEGQYEVVVSPRLRNYGGGKDYSKAWGLFDLSQPFKPFIWQQREAISTAAQVDWSSEDMFKRGKMNFGAQARYGFSYWDWRLAVGSKGS